MHQKLNIKLTPATCITSMRLALAPALAWALVTNRWTSACIILVVALVSDFFDGFIARKFGHTTNFGALLDTLADKIIMLILTSIALVSVYSVLPTWFLVLVLIKEIAVFAGAAYLWLSNIIVTTTPIYLGKITMAIQMGVFLWALMHKAYLVPFWSPVLFVAALTLVATIALYVRVFAYQTGLAHEA